MRKRLIIITIVVLAVVGGLSWWLLSSNDPQSHQDPSNPETAQPSAQTNPPSQAEPKTTIRIAAMGDMLPHDTVNLRAQTANGYDYTQFFSPVQNHISGDIVFCNQESPSAGEAFGISGYPSFNAPIAFARDLSNIGCNAIGLANNHIADKGQAAIDGTLTAWDALPTLAVTGANRSPAEQAEVPVFTVNGKRVALVAFTDLSNNTLSAHSVNLFSTSLVQSLMTTARQQADIILVSAHWGIEDSPTPSAAQIEWATLLANEGADVIIGTGPHVLQPVDRIGDTLVLYSLGNFLSTQLTIEQLTGGIAYIDIPLDGGQASVSFLPTYMHYTWTADQAAVEDLLARNNLKLYPLDQASSQIEASLFATTAAEQLQRIEAILNQNAPTKILPSN